MTAQGHCDMASRGKANLGERIGHGDKIPGGGCGERGFIVEPVDLLMVS